LTFHLELDLLLATFKPQSPPHPAPIQHVLHEVLTAHNIPAEIRHPGTPEGSPPRWKITWSPEPIRYNIRELITRLYEQTRDRKPRNVGDVVHGVVEVVSPRFYVFEHRRWRKELEVFFECLRECFAMEFNEETGLRVHIGYDGEKIPLEALKNIAVLLTSFESISDAFHPHPRPHLISNKDIQALKSLPPICIFRLLSSCKKTSELLRIVNPPHEDSAGMYNYKYDFTQVKSGGTVGFRQHVATDDEGQSGIVTGEEMATEAFWEVVGSAVLRAYYELEE
ncbi:hypothetical protein RUND412_004161, partial [Rhizina undulata]